MREFKVFKKLSEGTILQRQDGWQYAPLHWVFAVKHDLRHKARLVMGGHVTTADELDKYAATTSLDGVKLQLFLTARSNKNWCPETLEVPTLTVTPREKYGLPLDQNLKKIKERHMWSNHYMASLPLHTPDLSYSPVQSKNLAFNKVKSCLACGLRHQQTVIHMTTYHTMWTTS